MVYVLVAESYKCKWLPVKCSVELLDLIKYFLVFQLYT